MKEVTTVDKIEPVVAVYKSWTESKGAKVPQIGYPSHQLQVKRYKILPLEARCPSYHGATGTCTFYDSSIQLCSTMSRTRRLYSRRFSLYKREASEFAGEAGFGSHSKD
jgi:hypothetical protein